MYKNNYKNNHGNKYMLPVIVCIAKREHDYIEEFVKYHLALGFKRIYLYDNEDEPTYETLLSTYNNNIKVIHLPFNNYSIPVQHVALNDFVKNHLSNSDITHVAHIDIDEFIVLKKHENISEFIDEYIVGDCGGIGINWRHFGSSHKTEKSNEPVTQRFTMCQLDSNGPVYHNHIKTLFKKDNFAHYNTCHDCVLTHGFIKSTDGTIIIGPYNAPADFNVIQLNHYKCKTLEEFRYIRTRQRADIIGDIHENVDELFKFFDTNDIEDLTAKKFYETHCM